MVTTRRSVKQPPKGHVDDPATKSGLNVVSDGSEDEAEAPYTRNGNHRQAQGSNHGEAGSKKSKKKTATGQKEKEFQFNKDVENRNKELLANEASSDLDCPLPPVVKRPPRSVGEKHKYPPGNDSNSEDD
ncbi:hypothetical protein CVT24_002419, partial [Panaeolus cyanescens]